MSKNRIKQRENRKRSQIEARLDSKNSFGINDPTPKGAVERIIKGGKLDGHET